MPFVSLHNRTSTLATPLGVYYCSSFFCRLRGLMFKASIPPQHAWLLVESGENRIGTAIHMLFMRFPIAAIWINANFEVVDVKLALPWRLLYVPAVPAQYILEAHPDRLSDFHIGDKLELEYA